MLGDGRPLHCRAPWEELSNSACESGHVFGIDRSASLGRALSGELAGAGVGETLPFGAGERFLPDQNALPFIPIAGLAEADDDGAQRRVAPGAARESSVAAREEYEMVEIGASEAQGSARLEAEETALAQVFSAAAAGGIAADPEDDNLVGAGVCSAWSR